MQVRQGRVNFATLAELPEGAPIMTGTFSIDYKPVIILFDSGATHSFISDKCGARVGLDSCQTKGSYMISTPGGKISSNQLIRYVPIQLGSKVIKTNLILLHLEGMDIILGMDWMTKHKVLLDISSRVIEIDSPYDGTTTLYLPQQEYFYSCVYATIDIKLEGILIVCEYPDVFPDDLLGCHQIGTSSSLLSSDLAQLLFVAEPPELFQLKCANDHRTTAISLTHFKRTIPWSVGSPPDTTTVQQDRSRFTSHEGEFTSQNSSSTFNLQTFIHYYKPVSNISKFIHTVFKRTSATAYPNSQRKKSFRDYTRHKGGHQA
jgi:hypothetical protein